MNEYKLSDEEIVKALEFCIESTCDKCPYFKKKIDCAGGRQEQDCLELINRLGKPTAINSWKNKFLNALKEKEEQQRYIDYLQRKLAQANVTYRSSL